MFANLDTIAKLVTDAKGRSQPMNYRQVREVLRILGQVLREFPEAEREKIFRIIVHGNKIGTIHVERPSAQG